MVRAYCTAVLLLSLAGSYCSALVATGTPPFGSFGGGPDIVNLGNLNVHWDFPIMNKAGRGTPFNYEVGYDSSVWYPGTSSGATAWLPTPLSQLGWPNTAGFTGAKGSINYQTQTQSYSYPCGPTGPASGYIYTYTNWTYLDASNTTHSFPSVGTQVTTFNCNSGHPNATGVSSDGYTINITNGTTASTTSPTGLTFTPSAGCASPPTTGTNSIDRNGNEITSNGCGNFTDTLNIIALSITGSSTASPVVFSPSAGGPFKLYYTSNTVRTNFGCPVGTPVNEYGPTVTMLPSQLILPDGSSYSFAYEQTTGYSGDVTGRISKITLPTGGVISYSYTGGDGANPTTNGIFCADGSTATLTRTTPDGIWTYARSESGSVWTTTVTPPSYNGSQDQTVSTFLTDTLSNFYEISRQMYSGSVGSGTLLETILTCYESTVTYCSPVSGDTGTSIGTISRRQVTSQWPGSSGTSAGFVETYNANESVTEHDDYDFAAAGTDLSARTPLQKTLTSYTSAWPSEIQVFDSASHQLSDTKYVYDETTGTGHAPLVNTPGLPQSFAVSGSRFNLTTLSQWVNTTSTYLNSYYAYDDTGNVVTATSPNGVSTYVYDSKYAFQTSATLPTPSSGVSLGTSATYDYNAGIALTATDPNLQTTTLKTYDTMLHPTEIDYPDSGKTTASYTETQQTVKSYQNATTYTDTETQLDSYGRTTRVKIANGQSTPAYPWYQQDTCYDALGRMAFQSSAYQQAGWGYPKVCSVSGDAYLYDALGRLIKITHADSTAINYSFSGRATKVTNENGVSEISQVDGLGRMTAVCEVSGAVLMGVSPVNCGLDVAGTGFLTTYSYSLQNGTTTVTQGTQSRTFQVDSLGRTISVQEPESGTTTYTYAYNGTGLLTTRKKPKANQSSPTVLTTTTTQYDSLGRVVTVNYDDSVTAAKQFDYDKINTATGWSQTVTNVKGNLADMASGSGTSLTGGLFSYDAMARALTLWQCAPSICGTSNQAGRPPLQFLYDWAGNLTQESDATSGQIAYGRSQVGELTSVTNQTYTGTGNPANLVSSVANGPNGPVSYALGNGTNVAMTYDSTGRLSGGFLCLGSTAPNCSGGTEKYGYTVQAPGGRVSQDCDTVLGGSCINYGYDDFNRLTSQTVASHNFTYVYDRYGNRTQQNLGTGTAGPAPQYSFNSANQITGTPNQYDAAGNMTNDSVHTYTYDADGNILTVDGGSTAKYVYDPLNRRVGTQIAGSAYEYLYDTAGQLISSWMLNVTGYPAGFGIEGRIYADGQQIAYRAYDGTTYFDHKDYLGTERMRTNYTGAVASTYASLPSGDGYTPNVSMTYGDEDLSHFAGLDQDSQSGDDHAQFRNYSPTQGRWLSPDPYSGSYDLSNPQSMNRYSYALNSPLQYTDLSGLNPAPCSPSPTHICVTVFTCPLDPPPGCVPVCYDNRFYGYACYYPIAPTTGGQNPGGSAPNNGMFQLVSQTQPCSANPVNAFTLDYSQLLYNGGTQSTQAHIMQRHGNTGLPGVSQYFGNFSQIQNINAATYLFGNQALQGTSVVFQYTFPQPLAPVATMHLGTDAAGQHTSSNRLITKSDCRTVVTSYPF